MAEADQLRKFMVEEKRKSQEETLSVLDVLRKTRKARGGVGAPLDVPAHLRGAADGKPSIIITDEDLK